MTYHYCFSQVRTNDIFLSFSRWIYFSDSLAWQGSIVFILQVEETKATVTQKTHSDRAPVLTCTQLLLPMHFSFLCISVFFWELALIFQAQHILSLIARASIFMNMNPKACEAGVALSYWSPTERLVGPSCPTAHRSEIASEAEFRISFNHINEAYICIAAPKTLLQGAQTFPIYSPARPVTSLPPQCLGNETNRNAAAYLCKSV